MAGRERFERIVDLLRISGADGTGVHDLSQAVSGVEKASDTINADFGNARFANLASQSISTAQRSRRTWTTNRQKVRPQTTDQPLQEDLEHGSIDESVKQSHDSVVEVPEAADADLHAGHDEDGDDAGQERSEPDGDDVLAQGVGELRVHDFAILEVDGERASRGGRGVVNLCFPFSGCCLTARGPLTPRPTAPRTTIVRRSSQTVRNHCPMGGRRFV